MELLDDLQARGLIQDTTDRAALAARLADGPVTVYHGIDPTADSLHVGNLIGVLMLRRFAEAGHTALGLAGGATGMIGDPGGRSEERNLLDDETLAHNFAAVAEQVARISGVELVDNATWTRPISFLEFLRDVGKHMTVNQMMARESVKARLESEHGISFTEFSYQLVQANDYLHLHRTRGCELQMGGSDQWGNIVAGVELIRKADATRVHALVWPLILRSDGKKFGKSESGAVWIGAHRTSPYQFFQYWMQTPDPEVRRFLLQLTMLPVAECNTVADAHDAEPGKRRGQRRLAREVTTLVHGADAAVAAEEASAILFGGDPTVASPEALAQVAEEIPVSPVEIDADLLEVLATTPLVSSKGDARRQLAQGAVSVNGSKAGDDRILSAADLLHGRWILLRRGKTYHLLDAAGRWPPP